MSVSGDVGSASVLCLAFGARATRIASVGRKKKPRPSPLSLRLSHKERARLERDAAGMALGAYIKSRLFDDAATPRRSHRKNPIKDHAALARVLRALGGAPSCAALLALAQASKQGRVELSDEQAQRLVAACADIRAIRRDVVAALGLPEVS